jgi:hypothetical protein
MFDLVARAWPHQSFVANCCVFGFRAEVKTWDKVNSGLLKMYRVEVLGKHAVVQHFIYSSFLPAAPAAVPAPHIDVPVVRTFESFEFVSYLSMSSTSLCFVRRKFRISSFAPHFK